MAAQAVLSAFLVVRALRCCIDQERAGLNPTLRGVADIALPGQMVLWALVAVAAHVLYTRLAIDMATRAR